MKDYTDIIVKNIITKLKSNKYYDKFIRSDKLQVIAIIIVVALFVIFFIVLGKIEN